MARSKPEHRERILRVLAQGTLRAPDLEELRKLMGMEDVSKDQFSCALNSLREKHRLIRVDRPGQTSRDSYDLDRPFTVYLVKRPDGGEEHD